MRILVYGINYAPELTGIGKYTAEMCEWLTGNGHEVKVICAPPYYPAWKVADGYSPTGYSRERLNNVAILRCPLWVPARQSAIRRILHLVSFATSSLPIILGTALTWRPQVVFVVEPPFFCTPAALLAARLAGAKSWLHIQDLEIDAAFALGLIRTPLLKSLLGGMERFIMGMFDRVSAVSRSMLDNIRRKGVGSDFSGFFPNWVDSDAIYPILGRSMLRDEWGIARDSIVVLYSGNMGEKQGLEILVEAARILASEKRILFVVSGDGASRQRLETSATVLDNIRFTPLQPASRLNELLNLADIHILPQRADVASLVMPSKLLGMLASGRPVVATATADSELAGIVSRCGVVVPPGEALGMAMALRSLAHDPEQRSRLGVAARALCVEEWDCGCVFADFERQLKFLSGGRCDA